MRHLKLGIKIGPRWEKKRNQKRFMSCQLSKLDETCQVLLGNNLLNLREESNQNYLRSLMR